MERPDDSDARSAALDWDVRLVDDIAAGDDGALATAFDQYAPLVFGVAQRLAGASAAAEVTVEVFTELWERPDEFRPDRGPLRTFLAVRSRRRALDRVRRRDGSVRHGEPAVREASALAPNVDEAAAAMIAAERVRAATDALADEQRRAVELAYFHGLTVRELAIGMGVAERTATTRLHVAVGALHAALVGVTHDPVNAAAEPDDQQVLSAWALDALDLVDRATVDAAVSELPEATRRRALALREVSTAIGNDLTARPGDAVRSAVLASLRPR